MSTSDPSKRLTLRGIVVPVQWDPKGLVRKVAIHTRDEGEYEVSPGGAGAQLMGHLQSEVVARAVPANGLVRPKRIRVLSFVVVDWKVDCEDDREPDVFDAVRGC